MSTAKLQGMHTHIFVLLLKGWYPSARERYVHFPLLLFFFFFGTNPENKADEVQRHDRDKDMKRGDVYRWRTCIGVYNDEGETSVFQPCLSGQCRFYLTWLQTSVISFVLALAKLIKTRKSLQMSVVRVCVEKRDFGVVGKSRLTSLARRKHNNRRQIEITLTYRQLHLLLFLRE